MASRSPFDVLGVGKNADSDEIRSAYKKLALKWHPDKNMHCIEEATEKFKEIQAAFSVLSDPVARASLDDEGNLPTDGAASKKNNDFVGLVNLQPFFSPACYSGYGDGPDSFYSVFDALFAKVDGEEGRFQEFDIEAAKSTAPAFGSSAATDDAVKAFYSYWEYFTSKMTFAWVDEYDPAEAPNRTVRRLIEKENKKHRDLARKRRTEHVRSLVLLVKSMDKRVMKMAMQARAAAEAKAKAQQEAAQKREQEKIDARRKRKEHMESMVAAGAYDETPAGTFYRADDDDEHFGKRGKAKGRQRRATGDDDGDNDDEDDQVLFRCEACSKTFKSDKQLQNHEKSRKHLDAVATLREMFMEEDRQFDDAGLEGVSGDGDEEAELAAAFDGLATHDTTADARSIPIDAKDSDSSSADDEDDEIDIAAAMEHARVTHHETDVGLAATPTIPQPTPAAGDGDDEDKVEAVNKLSAKQKREARRAKKAEKAAVPSTSASAAPRVINELQCQTCEEEFTSRNKLMAHVKKTGHAVYIGSAPPAPAPTDDRKASSKKNSRANRRGDDA